MQNVPPILQTLAHIGTALSTWTQVEMAMTSLFANVSGMQGYKAVAVFDGIISLEVRLGILDRLMALEDIDDTEKEMWVRLSARITKAYKKRHELAHFSLMASSTPNEFAISPFLTVDKLIGGKIKALSGRQIEERTHRFAALSFAVEWFRDQAIARRTPAGTNPPPSLPEPPLVPQIRTLAIQTLEAKKRQPPQAKPEDNW